MAVTSRGTMGVDLELCLDFTDSVDWRTSSHAEDQLVSYPKLLEWSRRHHILDAKQETTLSNSTSKNDSERVLADAVRLREAIYRIFSAIAHKKKADAKDLGILNEFLARGLPRLRVAESEEVYGWDWSGTTSPDMMIYPIASSAASLLTSDDISRIRECANEQEGCGSLFLDCSKSQTRRWCSMKSCGNRSKFRAYYDRHMRGNPTGPI
jgi:predicted RNA-binding Zn ribbon-like protein